MRAWKMSNVNLFTDNPKRSNSRTGSWQKVQWSLCRPKIMKEELRIESSTGTSMGLNQACRSRKSDIERLLGRPILKATYSKESSFTTRVGSVKDRIKRYLVLTRNI